MKVGTDSVLLGAWCNVREAGKILDVGTGTGILAMMAAQRSEAAIDAIEIDHEAYLQAIKNVQGSIFAGRIRVHHADFNSFAETCDTQYDSILSNPPYFDNSLLPLNQGRSIARHNESLGLAELIQKSTVLLSKNGTISIIIPFSKEVIARQIAGESGLTARRSLYIKGKARGQVKRILIEWSKISGEREMIGHLTISDRNNNYSPAFKKLTGDFYLDI